jgi:MoaA/NifB/PqqE/SkfB family radical SAM enzyme
MLYYGDEIGLAADDDGGDAAARTFEDSWPDRQPMPWDRAGWDVATLGMVRGALALRRDREVLRTGDEEITAPAPDVVCLRRRRRAGDGDVIDVVLHRGAAPVWVTLPHGDDARVLLAVGDARLEPGTTPARVRLGARSAIVVDRRREVAEVELALRDHNAALAAQAFRDGHVATPAYPARLYLTVTEACNLRCLHCITDAPERSRSGTARTLAPWLLDALDEAFAHADHVAFTHGGESLTAPGFGEVLRRIQRARGGRRTDVHLITNGTLLDEARLRSLIERGVTSLMVSLDGATARSNDAIRVLGRFDRVVAHLAGAVKLRAELGADLRIGVSTVLGRSNVGELAAIGRLCRDLGVDWLKVEETYPATPFARRDAIAADAPEVRAAMAALRDALAGSPIVLVDHLAPPAGCACGGDPAVAAFQAADDFANRFAFRPCRAAWQQAAVDPDGTVHVGDYAGPALGNLLDAPFLDLWNAPAAIAVRERALAASPELRRRMCVGAT